MGSFLNGLFITVRQQDAGKPTKLSEQFGFATFHCLFIFKTNPENRKNADENGFYNHTTRQFDVVRMQQ